MSKKEVKELIANAKSREDHQILAAHYRHEAERLLVEAKEHEEMAEQYRRNPHPLTQKNPAAFGERHCRQVADRLRQAATRMQALAGMHEDLAKKATP